MFENFTRIGVGLPSRTVALDGHREARGAHGRNGEADEGVGPGPSSVELPGNFGRVHGHLDWFRLSKHVWNLKDQNIQYNIKLRKIKLNLIPMLDLIPM